MEGVVNKMKTTQQEKQQVSNIKLLRVKHNLTQKELAVAVGIERTALTRIERGERLPSLEIAYKISSCFGKTIDDVFFSELDVT